MLAASSPINEPFVRLLLGLAIILVLGKAVGVLCRIVKQPIVIGEIIAGIVLGPSVLGLFPGDLNHRIFPLEVLPYLKIVSQLGLVLFMFIVGLEVDLQVVRASGKRALAIGLVAIVIPFTMGAGILGTWLHGQHQCVPVVATKAEASVASGKQCTSPEVERAITAATKEHTKTEVSSPSRAASVQIPVGRHVEFSHFAIFLGVAMSGTAFAVLARILAERNMFKIPLGALLIACAAIDDLLSFLMLAVAVAVSTGKSASSIVFMLLELLAFIAVLVGVGRPVLNRLVVAPYRRSGRLEPAAFGVLLIGLMISAFVSSVIGVHELIGAFLFGLFVPRANADGMFHTIAEKLDGVSVRLLLPVFFVVAGQGVNVKGLRAADIGPMLAILGVAFVSKFFGAGLTARAMGIPRRQSLAVGTLMNTRGLAELVILAVAREAGVLTDSMYTMLVIMAVVTTAMAGPLLRLVYPDKWLERDIREAERLTASSGLPADRVVVVVDDPAAAEALVDLALAYGGGRPTTSMTLVRMLPNEAGLTGAMDSMQAMQGLRRRAESAGVSCSAVSRASTAPEADVLAEVRRLAPDAVFLSPGHEVLVESVRAEGADVVVVRGPVPTDVGFVAPGGSSADEQAALELAVRLALRFNVPVSPTGLTRRVQRQLRRLGVDQELRPGSASISSAVDGALVSVRSGARDRLPLAVRLGSWRLGDQVVPLSSV